MRIPIIMFAAAAMAAQWPLAPAAARETGFTQQGLAPSPTVEWRITEGAWTTPELFSGAPVSGLTPARRAGIESGFPGNMLSGGLARSRARHPGRTPGSGERDAAFAGQRGAQRYSLSAGETHISLHYPLARGWASVIETSAGLAYDLVPRYTLSGSVYRSLGDGWGLSLGVRRSVYFPFRPGLTYDPFGAHALFVTGERHFGDFRAAYTLSSGSPHGAGTVASRKFELDYHYGERNAVGFSLTSGREALGLEFPGGTIPGDSRNFSITGRHWLTPDWALSYGVGALDEGGFYRRQGVRLGLRYSF